MVLRSYLPVILSLSLTLLLSACAVIPKHIDSQQGDAGQHFVRKVQSDNQDVSVFKTLAAQRILSEGLSDALVKQPFSRGDWVQLKIHAMPDYDGLYQINARGTASIEVSVYGAVFNQGRVTINSQPATKPMDIIQQQAGSHSSGRDLIAALNAAGGVRPDANVHEITLKRNKRYFSLNIEQLITGSGYASTPSLVHGDTIYIESNGVEDVRLIRPSQITPPGMRVLMSNLTAPALNNALSAVGADATRLPYGASLLDAAVSANCVGGTHQANASRSILLITRHYGAKEQIVINRSINQLLADSSDYSVNPYLMPNDGVACYDSKFTNIRDVARGVGELFGPILLGGIL